MTALPRPAPEPAVSPLREQLMRRALDWLREKSRAADSIVAAFPPVKPALSDSGEPILRATRDGESLTVAFDTADPHRRRIVLSLWTRQGHLATQIAQHLPPRGFRDA